jgi:hypothetical protein
VIEFSGLGERPSGAAGGPFGTATRTGNSVGRHSGPDEKGRRKPRNGSIASCEKSRPYAAAMLSS